MTILVLTTVTMKGVVSVIEFDRRESVTNVVFDRYLKQLFVLKSLLVKKRPDSKKLEELWIRLDEARQIFARAFSFEQLLLFHLTDVLVAAGYTEAAIEEIIRSIDYDENSPHDDALKGSHIVPSQRVEDAWLPLSGWLVEASRSFDDGPDIWNYIPSSPLMHACEERIGREFLQVGDGEERREQDHEVAEGNEDIKTEMLATPLENLDFSVRTYNPLKKAGINTLAILLEQTKENLLGIERFGKRNLEEVKNKLTKMGCSLHPN